MCTRNDIQGRREQRLRFAPNADIYRRNTRQTNDDGKVGL